MLPIRDFSDDYASKTEKSPDIRQQIAETETLSAIIKVCDLARRQGRLALIIGGPGVGKTTAFRHICDTSRNTFMATLSRSARTLSAGADLMLDAFGVGDLFYRGVREKVKAVTAAMMRCADRRIDDEYPKPLLIIDESQHAVEDLLEELRQINDRTGVGTVLSGNPSVLTRWYHRGEPRPRFAHLTGRIAAQLHIQEPTAADVDRIARHHGIDDSKSIEFLRTQARHGEGLRPAIHIIEFARDFLADGQQITTAHLKAARGLKTRTL